MIESMENEMHKNDLYFVDTNGTDQQSIAATKPIATAMMEAATGGTSISYVCGTTSITKHSEATAADRSVNTPSRRVRCCYNCGDPDHNMRDCPLPRNDKERRERKSEQMKDMYGGANSSRIQAKTYRGRYHVPTDAQSERFRVFRPGSISASLRDALGMRSFDIPPYIYQMWNIGYPPAYVGRRDGQELSNDDIGLKIYGGDGELLAEDSASCMKSGSGDIDAPDTDDKEMIPLVKYPGYNAPLPENVRVLSDPPDHVLIAMEFTGDVSSLRVTPEFIAAASNLRQQERRHSPIRIPNGGYNAWGSQVPDSKYRAKLWPKRYLDLVREKVGHDSNCIPGEPDKSDVAEPAIESSDSNYILETKECTQEEPDKLDLTESSLESADGIEICTSTKRPLSVDAIIVEGGKAELVEGISIGMQSSKRCRSSNNTSSTSPVPDTSENKTPQWPSFLEVLTGKPDDGTVQKARHVWRTVSTMIKELRSSEKKLQI